VGRPKVPLISKRAALEAALRIIDEEGLEELSIRRLAHALDVNGASLYHHFKNKDEILLGAARLALEDARLLESPDADWREWFIDQARLYRRVLLEHPSLVPVILKQHPHRIAMEFYDQAVQILLDSGVPAPSIIPLIESMESHTFGSVLYTMALRKDADEVGESFPALREARRRAMAHVDDEQLWETVARAITHAVLEEERRTQPSRRPAAELAAASPLPAKGSARPPAGTG
jgi:TetR/AcrR family transcriptional regulator, tetracycline repressor protein